ncbi:MAG: Mut7-C RNAse domain-containing protein [Halobacteriales archaeon]
MRFLLDVMLGKLATYLRMCGHDAAYALDRGGANDAGNGDETGNDGGGGGGGIEDDDALLALVRGEGRRLVTRDADLAGRANDAILLSAMDIDGQLRELHAAGVDLSLDRPERCSRCNGRVDRVESGKTPEYAPDVDARRVWRCRACGQHYWKGSHWEDVRERLRDV